MSKVIHFENINEDVFNRTIRPKGSQNNMSRKLNSNLSLGAIFLGLTLFFTPSAKSAIYYWDTTGGAGNGVGGTGSWTSTTATWSTENTGSATLVTYAGVATDTAIFGGTAGKVTFGGSMTSIFNVNTTGYTFSNSSTTARTLTGNVVLANGVKLGLTSFSAGGLAFAGGTISGGTGSSLALGLGETSGKRLVRLDSNAIVDASAPITFDYVGTAVGDYLALGNSSGTGTVNSTISGNNASGNMIFQSAAILKLNGAISGSQGVSIGGNGLSVNGRVELNASNSYAGKTTLNGGNVYVSNNFAFSTNAIVVASNSTVRGIAVSTASQIANAVEFGTSGANLSIGGDSSANSIALNGLITGNGIISSGAKSGGNSLYLMNTNNTFSGGVISSNGNTLYTANLGSKASTASALGTSATITLGNATTSGGIRWLGSAGGNEVSDKDFVLLGTNSILANGVTGATLTLNGALNSTGAGGKAITLAGYNNNSLIVNGLINEFLGSTNSVTVGVSSSGKVVLGNTNNSFSGAVTIGQATADQSTVLETAQIGNSGANSTLGRNGTINIGSSSSSRATTLRYVGAGETSDKVINLSGTEGGAILEQSGATGNLKFTSAMTATGIGAKTVTLQGSTAGTGELAANILDLGGNVIGLTKAGTGAWKLSGSNSYSGNTEISAAGNLQLGSTNALSRNSSLLGASSITNAGTLNVTTGGDYVAKSFGTAGVGGFNMNFTNSSGSAATLTFTNAENYITLSSAGSASRTLLNQSENLEMRFNGNIDIGSSSTNNVTLGGVGNFLVSGSITNGGAGVRGLEKTGAGTLTLAGSGNNFNGTTTIKGGTLALSGNLTGSTNLTVSTAGTSGAASASRAAAATLNVTIGGSLLSNSVTTVYSGGNLIVNGTAGGVVLESNGLLGGTGTMGDVNLKAGSYLTPGNSPGLLTAASATWAAGSTYNWEIDNATGTAGTNWDVFSVTGALDMSALSSSAQMNLVLESLSIANYSTSTSFSWVIAQAGSFTGYAADNTDLTSLFNINTAAFNGGTAANLPNGGFQVVTGTADGLRTLNLLAVPEPSTGSMLGLGFAGLVLTRLLRRKNS